MSDADDFHLFTRLSPEEAKWVTVTIRGGENECEGERKSWQSPLLRMYMCLIDVPFLCQDILSLASPRRHREFNFASLRVEHHLRSAL
jgi:hypothetical protein